MTSRCALGHYRGPWSEGIIRFNAPSHCFRTSRSLLGPLKWNSRLLFVIMTSLFHVSDLPFHLLKIITCSKQRKGALKRHSHNANSVNRLLNEPLNLICFVLSMAVLGELNPSCFLFCFVLLCFLFLFVCLFFFINYAYMCR